MAIENIRLMYALDELRDAIFATYTALAERDRSRITNEIESRWVNEHQRRQSALDFIDEILEWRPLASFSAVQLEVLESMIAYWREAEVEAGAPLPDPLQ